MASIFQLSYAYEIKFQIVVIRYKTIKDGISGLFVQINNAVVASVAFWEGLQRCKLLNK